MNDTNDANCAVDFARLREITGNDEALLKEISDQYLDQAELILTEIEAAIENDDHVQVSQLAHKLVGSSATCGMNGIVASLQKLEILQPYVSSIAIELLRTACHQLQQIRSSLSNNGSTPH